MGGPFDEKNPMGNLKRGLLMSRVPYNASLPGSLPTSIMNSAKGNIMVANGNTSSMGGMTNATND